MSLKQHTGNHIKQALLFFFVLLGASAISQPASFNFHHLTTASGLGSPVVRTITSDKYGYIWLGTVNGLSRFNGYDIKTLQHQPGDSLSLADNVVQSLFCDKNGSLLVGHYRGLYKYDYSNSNFILQKGSLEISPWKMLDGEKNEVYIATSKGLILFDTKAGSFTPIHTINKENEALLKKPVNDFSMPGNGHIYIATDSGLMVYNTKTFASQRVSLKPVKNFSLEKLAIDKNGNLWISYYDHGPVLLKTDLAFNSFEIYPQFMSPHNGYKDNLINSIFADNKGRVWVATNRQGLCLYDTSNNDFIQYEPDPLLSTSIATEFITFIYQDKQGFLWAGTEGYGTDYFHPDKNLFRSIQQSYNQTPTLPNNWGRAVGEDTDNNLWLGTGGGLAKYDQKTNKITVFKNTIGHTNILYANSIRSILCDGDEIWIGTGSGLNRYHRSTGKIDFLGASDSIPESFFWSIIKDHEGNIWFGCREGLYKYNHLTKKTENLEKDPLLAPFCRTNVRTLFEDSHHRLWIGFYSQGLVMYDPENKKVQHFKKNAEGTSEVKDGNILSITEDKKGLIWFSTLTDFSSYNVDKNLFKHYRNTESSMYEINSSFMCDDRDRLWIASSRGLYLLDSSRRFFKSFDMDDGLPSLDFNNQSAFRMHNGNLVYPTLKGFVLFNPDDYVQINDSINAFVSSFKIFGKNYSPASGIEEIKKISLDYDENFFSFEMTALNYTNPHQNWYAYKLEPFDKDWIYSKERLASYTNVPGGNYIFHYKTSTDREKWNVPEKKVSIHLGTVFYKTWWFRLAMLLSLMAIVYTIYRTRIRQREMVLLLEKKAYSLEREKALVMYESLKQQLNPHFLFNSLTSLSSLITSNPVNAKQFLERLSKIYRYILQSRDNETVPLGDEIKLAETYTQLQQTRFKGGLQLEIDVSEDYFYRKIAPVTLQNIIENAIKHNIIDITTPLLIQIYVEDGWLITRNNIQKKNFVETSNKQGLANMISLYHYLSGQQLIITEDEKYFTIKIPLL